MDEKEFIALADSKGYSEPELDEVETSPAKEMHQHPHSVLSLVLAGEFTMICENESTTYLPDDCCENPAGTVHTEQIGPNRVTALVATK